MNDNLPTINAIWAAAHRLTQPRRRHLPRELTDELQAARDAATERAWQKARAAEADYQTALHRHQTATVKATAQGGPLPPAPLRVEADPPEIYLTSVVAGMTIPAITVPSLWEQACEAIGTGREQQTSGSRSLASTRSVVDVDLLEVVALIRETVAHNLTERGITEKLTVADQINRLASLVTTTDGEDLDWWEYRLNSWGRLLTTYLNAGDHTPRPIRLRNAPCPLCHTRFVTVDGEAGPVQAPPLLINFTNGMVRAAECTACTAVWWRGDDLHALADQLNTQPANRERMGA